MLVREVPGRTSDNLIPIGQGMSNKERSDGPEQRRLRELKIQRLRELIRKDEYVVDADLLADAILKHLGMHPRSNRRRRSKK